MKGYTDWENLRPKEQTEELAVTCRRCGNVWHEMVTHWGVLAGYARTYDYCDRCITPEEKKEVSHD